MTVWRMVPQSGDRETGSEVVGHPADRLDVGVLSLPLGVAAVVSSLHNVHVAAVVRLLIQHPAGWTYKYIYK